MFYKGRLRVAGDEGDGIPVDLSLDDVYVDLRASGGEELGRWRMDVVEVTRLEGSDFQLLLDGEDMIFRASDPLGFAYNAVTTIEDIASRLRRRRRGLFRRKTDTPQMMRGADPDTADAESEGAATERIRDLSSLMPPDEDVELPPDDDVFSEFAVEEDVPAVAYSDDESLVDATPDPEWPVEAFESGLDDAPADDEMQTAYEPPEIAEASEGVERDGDVPDAEPLESAPGTDSAERIGSGSERPERDAPAAEPEHAEPDREARADELEQEVSPATSGAAPEVEHTVPEERRDRPDEPDAPDSPPETPAPAGGQPRQDAARRRGLFRRGKVDPDHVHEYDESKTVGGITRRVCSVCGHVSFAGEDLYEGWK